MAIPIDKCFYRRIDTMRTQVLDILQPMVEMDGNDVTVVSVRILPLLYPYTPTCVVVVVTVGAVVLVVLIVIVTGIILAIGIILFCSKEIKKFDSYHSTIRMMISVVRSFRVASSQCFRYASTLVVADAGIASTQSAVTAASQLGGDQIDLLVVGESAPSMIPTGVTTTHFVETHSKLPETMAAAIHHVIANSDNRYSHLVTAHTKVGSTVLPRASALLGVSPVTDVLRIESHGKNKKILHGSPCILYLTNFQSQSMAFIPQ
jgi:Electron transfer flavoprotein domain